MTTREFVPDNGVSLYPQLDNSLGRTIRPYSKIININRFMSRNRKMAKGALACQPILPTNEFNILDSMRLTLLELHHTVLPSKLIQNTVKGISLTQQGPHRRQSIRFQGGHHLFILIRGPIHESGSSIQTHSLSVLRRVSPEVGEDQLLLCVEDETNYRRTPNPTITITKRSSKSGSQRWTLDAPRKLLLSSHPAGRLSRSRTRCHVPDPCPCWTC